MQFLLDEKIVRQVYILENRENFMDKPNVKTIFGMNHVIVQNVSVMSRILFSLVLKVSVFYGNIEFGDAIPLISDHIKVAESKEFQFVVSIGWKESRTVRGEETHFCGGALITKKHVLTAAHCFLGVEDIKNVEVKIGSNDLHKCKKYSISAWDTYDNWVFRNYMLPEYLLGNDISIITLKSKVVGITPAYISQSDNDQWIGKTAVIAGWGMKKNGERTRYLEKASLNISSHAECNRKINEANLVEEVIEVPLRFLCTNAEPYVVLGYGDSGSPLLVNNNIIIAINKSSCPRKSTCVSSEQNLHVGVHHYRKFISNITKSTETISEMQNYYILNTSL